MYFLLTNDVEEQSISLNKLDDETALTVYRKGLPQLLDLYSKYDIEGTFYFTGTFAEKIPEAIELVIDCGHEIGCHGHSHEVNRAFEVLRYGEQVDDLIKAKKAIGAVAGRIDAFRAPALRINEYTAKALEETGFKTDSSVASQRFDGPLSFGAKNKLKWLFAPRLPYYLSYKSPYRKGDSSILEVPVSAWLLGYTGTTMRVSPQLNRYLEKILFLEARKREKPIVFLFHPTEVLEVNGKIDTKRRANGVMSYFFGDILRQKIKLKNLGRNALMLLEEILKEGKKKGFEFLSVGEYYRLFRG